ncbi:MAG: alpha/beta hydrolase [candidate division Zixibacteria bacterium]|nr:alpha/beta hydrolase [candidate division Zixibacteria bacterium]
MAFHKYRNQSLFYETFGQGERALLFIHGLAAHSNCWKYQVDFFKDRFLIVTVDLFGHGQSSKDVDPIFAPRIDAEAIVGLMNQVIKKPFIAIGHSFASQILPEIVKLDSPYLKGVVFVDCTYQGFEDVIKARADFGTSLLKLSDNELKVEAEKWYSGMIAESSGAEHQNLIMSGLKYCNYRWLFQSVAGCVEYNLKYPPDKTPIKNDLPIFIMETDSAVGADFRKSWVNHFKNARYFLFEKADHFVFITQHSRFNGFLDEFISDCF